MENTGNGEISNLSRMQLSVVLLVYFAGSAFDSSDIPLTPSAALGVLLEDDPELVPREFAPVASLP